MKIMIVFFFIALVICLFYIQCLQSYHYSELSKRNRIRLLPLIAPRGNIYDRNGKLLAGNRLAFDCAVIPQEFNVDDKGLSRLSGLLELSEADLKKKLKEDFVAPFIPLIIKKDIGKETAISISERSVDFPGLIIQTYPTRHYPNSNVAGHIAGYVGKISEEELDVLREYGYKPMDLVGRGGIEFYYDDYLKGESGGMQIEVDAKGRELRVLGIREPSKGRDITTTIDIELEAFIDSLLEEHNGAVVVMDAEDGEVIGLVSKPDFNPNIFVSSSGYRKVTDLLGRSDYPLVNRAISGTYPPGSVFKIVTASAALDSGSIKHDEQLDCKGSYALGYRTFSCWKKSGHKLQTMAEGIKNSCNVFFYKAGRKTGVDKIEHFAALYGFGSKSGIDLPYESEGIVPGRSWKKREKMEKWYEGDTVNYAIGQGYLLVTPIQIARMINALALEGQMISPFIVKKIGDIDVSGSHKSWLNISGGTFNVIKEGTRRAVEDDQGTAKHAGVPGIEIAGKTGTAQAGPAGTHAWFAGYSPAGRPKISLVVFLEYGGSGGDKPCKIAAKIFKKLKELDYL
ncbi:MAG: penicillin-binding protein 2 [Candidatus Omnitrophica bacterium]|nr:penicillin-binding protein 2 [Candidatus Omnitrophota bacterium]